VLGDPFLEEADVQLDQPLGQRQRGAGVVEPVGVHADRHVRADVPAHLEGEGLFTVQTGDTLYYPGSLAHRWRGVSEEQVRALFVQQGGAVAGAHDPR
jgi:hypothetical protein